jgi:HEAT repeat protein
MTAPRLALRLAAAALVLGGCVTEDPAPEGGESAREVRAAPSTQDAAEFGRSLVEMDRRVDEYVFLGSDTSAGAADRRGLLGTALEATTARYLEQLLAAAEDAEDPSRRRTSVKALAFTKDERAAPVLARCLATKGDERLLAGATFALARIADPATPLPPLLDAARDPDPDVRSNALLALWHVLDARRDAGLPPLDGATRASAVATMEPALFDLSDPIVRGNAAAALGALGDPRAVDSLSNLLRDANPFVRTHTALALGKLGDRRAIPFLLDAIDTSPQGTPRSAVILGLSLLLEAQGIEVPPNLPQEGRAWRGFVERSGVLGR